MIKIRQIAVLLSALSCVMLPSLAANLESSFVSDDGSLNLSLQHDDDGEVTGEMSDGFFKLALEGRLVEGRIVGDVLGDDDEELGFTASSVSNGKLELRLYPFDGNGEPMIDAANVIMFAPGNANDSIGDPSLPVQSSAHDVYINRVRLSEGIIMVMETEYQIPIQDGRYWYDANCGAWGLEGGPTAGFIIAGLNLPGPMPSDISQGGTGIFINGREVHPLDQLALQQIFGTSIPGRYWLDAQGNLGPEGGAPIANLAAAIQRSGGGGEQSGSVTHGYAQGSGSRGTAGGGMYSGRTATGKSVFWYPGM